MFGLRFKPLVLCPRFIFVSSMHCSQDSQIRNLIKLTLKLRPTVLFTYLKIILLLYFQFSIFNFQP